MRACECARACVCARWDFHGEHVDLDAPSRMRACVCTRARVRACARACVHVCMCACVRACVPAFACVRVLVLVRACVCVRARVCAVRLLHREHVDPLPRLRPRPQRPHPSPPSLPRRSVRTPAAAAPLSPNSRLLTRSQAFRVVRCAGGRTASGRLRARGRVEVSHAANIALGSARSGCGEGPCCVQNLV